MRDPERPLPRVVKNDSVKANSLGLWLDVTVGVGAALWFGNGDTALYKPFSFALDIGYEVVPELAIIARASTWLRTDDLANEYLGAGVGYRLIPEDMYIAATLGLGLTRTSNFDHYVQGIAAQVDIAQTFPLGGGPNQFAVGAHFQFGTPWGGSGRDAFTSLATGIFVAYGLR